MITQFECSRSSNKTLTMAIHVPKATNKKHKIKYTKYWKVHIFDSQLNRTKLNSGNYRLQFEADLVAVKVKSKRKRDGWNHLKLILLESDRISTLFKKVLRRRKSKCTTRKVESSNTHQAKNALKSKFQLKSIRHLESK